MPKTKAIKVKGVLAMPEGEIEWHNGSPVLKENLRLALETIKRLNPNIPISFLG
jgi:hypothetical protein